MAHLIPPTSPIPAFGVAHPELDTLNALADAWQRLYRVSRSALGSRGRRSRGVGELILRS